MDGACRRCGDVASGVCRCGRKGRSGLCDQGAVGRLVWWDRANVAEKTGVVSGNTYFLRCREDADVEGSETFGRPHA